VSRVGILTFHQADNYGAVLQAYGLAKAIEGLGHDVIVIDYRPEAARRHYGRRPSLRHPVSLVATYQFRRRFDRFRRSHLPLSRTYLTEAELRLSPPDVDYVICGSDQIWNVSSFRGFDPAFYCSFVEGETPVRVSYAASFGNARQSDLDANRERIRELLGRFECISVRDARSQEIVQDLAGRPSTHVLDPCFLGDFEAITQGRARKGAYIVAYFRSHDRTTTAAVRRLSQALCLPVVSMERNIGVGAAVRPDPCGWLSLMRHASFVCTNSFHGLCFSMINRTQFVVLPNPGRMSRIDDVLATTGLQHRLAHSPEGVCEVLRGDIDFDALAFRIGEAKRRSLEFLASALR